MHLGISMAAVMALCLTSGCASIVSHSSWPVAVNSSPPGATVTIKNEDGVTIHQAPTPFTITLQASDGYFDGADYTLETKYGITTLSSSLNPWYVGNIVFGGLIGLLIVDPATGAMWKLPKVAYVPGEQAVQSAAPSASTSPQVTRPTSLPDPIHLPRQVPSHRVFLGTEEIARRSTPAVFQVQCGDVSASGFGVTPDGYILTNHHVIEDGGEVRIVLPNGAEFSASVVAQVPRADVALLKVQGRDVPYLYLAEASRVEIGEEVVVIGAPLGLRGSVTKGIISAVRQLEEVSLIQTDAAVNVGNSGGPVLNRYGEVIGIASLTVRKDLGEGLGFAVDTGTIMRSLDLRTGEAP